MGPPFDPASRSCGAIDWKFNEELDDRTRVVSRVLSTAGVEPVPPTTTVATAVARASRRRRPALRRIGALGGRLVVVIFVVSVLVFLMLDLLPGDRIDSLVPPGATDEQREALAEALGLNDPLPVRFVGWLGGVLTGDFGASTSGLPVELLILQRLPVTLELAFGATIVSLLVAVPIAMLSAYRPGRVVDRVTSVFTSFFLSTPGFLLALLLVLVFAVWLKLLPISSWVPWSEGAGPHLRSVVLPIATLACLEASTFIRVLRHDLVGVLKEDYVLSARARGIRTRSLLIVHALRPAGFSLLTVLGVSLGRLLGGAVIVEVIFSLPGLGSLVIRSIENRDFLVVQGAVLVIAVGYVVINAIVDASYRLLDPRVGGH